MDARDIASVPKEEVKKYPYEELSVGDVILLTDGRARVEVVKKNYFIAAPAKYMRRLVLRKTNG